VRTKVTEETTNLFETQDGSDQQEAPEIGTGGSMHEAVSFFT